MRSDFERILGFSGRGHYIHIEEAGLLQNRSPGHPEERKRHRSTLSITEPLADKGQCPLPQPGSRVAMMGVDAWLRSRRKAEPNDEPRAATGFALGPDLSSETLDQPATDCQAEARPAVLTRARGSDLAELVEDSLELIAGNAGALVSHHALGPA